VRAGAEVAKLWPSAACLRHTSGLPKVVMGAERALPWKARGHPLCTVKRRGPMVLGHRAELLWSESGRRGRRITLVRGLVLEARSARRLSCCKYEGTGGIHDHWRRCPEIRGCSLSEPCQRGQRPGAGVEWLGSNLCCGQTSVRPSRWDAMERDRGTKPAGARSVRRVLTRPCRQEAGRGR
jgi:hypothetical protein